jgi:hypothetical protein
MAIQDATARMFKSERSRSRAPPGTNPCPLAAPNEVARPGRASGDASRTADVIWPIGH